MKLLLVGAGGYASGYVRTLLSLGDPSALLEGIVDPYCESSKVWDLITASGVPVYGTMEEFYASHSADLAIVCTPPFLHRAQSVYALSHGSYVLCEKPIAPTVSDAEAMQKAEEQYGKWIAIGYQWSFSDAILSLKRDILSGALGAAVSMKTAISWPRSRTYYGRGTGWGGRISKDGVMILDSIASNACAHYLHNMLFLLGKSPETSAEAGAFTADCLRANDIESFDTCAIRMKADCGTELYFIASHAAEARRDPEFVYEFEKATVTFAENEGSMIRAVFRDGTEKCYGDPFENNFKKLLDCIDAVKNGTRPICTVETATPHTRLIERLYREAPIRNFPRERVHLCEETNTVFVEGLYREMYEAYGQKLLLSELPSDF